MYKMFLFFVVLVLGASSCTPAFQPSPTHRIPIDKRLELTMTLPGCHWQLSQTPPAFVAQKMSDHLRQEVSATAPDIDDDQLLWLARKRLAINEGYVFNKSTGAWLMIDFSSRRDGKGTPSRSELWASAYGALLALENEEGVTEVESAIDKKSIAGVSKVCKVDVRYRLEGQPRSFVGIIGFKVPYRFYLYYNDLLRDPQDRIDMDRILNSLQLLQISPPE